jgi:hypothetical protein
MYEFEILWMRGGTTIVQSVWIDNDMLIELALEAMDDSLDDINLEGYEVKVIPAK